MASQKKKTVFNIHGNISRTCFFSSSSYLYWQKNIAMESIEFGEVAWYYIIKLQQCKHNHRVTYCFILDSCQPKSALRNEHLIEDTCLHYGTLIWWRKKSNFIYEVFWLRPSTFFTFVIAIVRFGRLYGTQMCRYISCHMSIFACLNTKIKVKKTHFNRSLAAATPFAYVILFFFIVSP